MQAGKARSYTCLLLLWATLLCCAGNFYSLMADHGFREDGQMYRGGHGKLVSLSQHGMTVSHQRFHKVGNGGGAADRSCGFTSRLSVLPDLDSLNYFVAAPTHDPAPTIKRWLVFRSLLI